MNKVSYRPDLYKRADSQPQANPGIELVCFSHLQLIIIVTMS
jgi:hypothetical protein